MRQSIEIGAYWSISPAYPPIPSPFRQLAKKGDDFQVIICKFEIDGKIDAKGSIFVLSWIRMK